MQRYKKFVFFVVLFCACLGLKPAALLAEPAYFPDLKLKEFKKIDAVRGGNQGMVLIVICPARPDHMSAYGYHKHTTPNLKALADDGIRFTRMYANAPWTRASTACILTGQNSSRNNCQRDIDKLGADKLTIAQRLRRAGYRTGGFVANGNASSLASLNRGFDFYRDSQSYWHKLASATEVVDEALGWIETVKKKKFFTLLFFVDPHDPYKAPSEYEKRFLPKNFSGEPKRHASWEVHNNYSAAERDQLISLYDAGLSYADHEIGRFIAGLKAKGLYDKTTIVMTGDHGEGFGEHGYYLHGHHFENEILRVPLIIKHPDLNVKGQYSDALVNSIDIVPTMLEIAGVKGGPELTGLPLLSSLAGPGIPDDRVIFSEYNEFGIRRSAIVRRDAKLILQRPADKTYLSVRLAGHLELLPSVVFDREHMTYYQLDQDPFEKHQAWSADNKTAQKMLKQLRTFLQGEAKQADGTKIWCRRHRRRCRKVLDAMKPAREAGTKENAKP